MDPDKPMAEMPMTLPSAPTRPLPRGAVDAHVHLIGDDPGFPLADARTEDPQSGCLDDWIRRFRQHQGRLGLSRTVVVHSILYGGDNSITLDAVRRLGPDTARAICLVKDGADEAVLDRLAAAHTAGIRLNYVHGGILSWAGAKALAPALADRGMHIQMLAHSHLHLCEIADDVRALAVPVVFDHIAWPDLGLGVNDPGFQGLLRLVGDGQAFVKLSGAYRVCNAPYGAADDHIEALLRANPERCLWGTDWPHLMLGDANLPDAGALLDRFLDLADDTGLEQVFVRNPERLYGFSQAS